VADPKKGFKVKVTMEITKDGEDFAKTTAEYSNMDYDNMQLLQGTIVKSVVGLGDAKLSGNLKAVA
jgi:hypothetical protein